MSKQSAGVLMYRERGPAVEVLLVHPGGPFWAKKDDRAWSIPKGEFSEGEGALDAAKREFREETGFEPQGDFQPLGSVRQPGGKTVHAWAIKGDADVANFKSNTFSMEWPPGSGNVREFPEVDRAAWFSLDDAKRKISKGQVAFLNQLENMRARGIGDARVGPTAASETLPGT